METSFFQMLNSGRTATERGDSRTMEMKKGRAFMEMSVVVTNLGYSSLMKRVADSAKTI